MRLKKKPGRLVAFLLALCMVMGMFPADVRAAGPSGDIADGLVYMDGDTKVLPGGSEDADLAEFVGPPYMGKTASAATEAGKEPAEEFVDPLPADDAGGEASAEAADPVPADGSGVPGGGDGAGLASDPDVPEGSAVWSGGAVQAGKNVMASFAGGVLTVGLAPAGRPVMLAGGGPTAIAAAPDRLAATLGGLAVGSIVKLDVGGTPTEFIVVQQGSPDGSLYSNADGTWLLARDVLERRAWDAGNVNAYEDSDIHAYLNGEWIAKLDPQIRDRIMEAKIPYRAGGGRGAIMSGAGGLSAKVFLLSKTEAGFSSTLQSPGSIGAILEYFWGLNTGIREDEDTYERSDKRIALDAGGNPAAWWLRSPCVDHDSDRGEEHDSNGATSVSVTGEDGSSRFLYNCDAARGVRPALILPSDTYVAADGSVDPVIIEENLASDGSLASLEAVAYDDSGSRAGSGWTYQWYRNGERIAGATGSVLMAVDGAGDRVVAFPNDYYCEASDGSVKRSAAYVPDNAKERSLGKQAIGSVVKLDIGGEPTEFVVVQHGNPDRTLYGGAYGTWLLSKDIVENRAWSSSNLNDYENSDIHAYLNGDWIAKLDPQIRDRLMEAKLPYRPGSGTGTAIRSGAAGLPAKAFLLSYAEAGFLRGSMVAAGEGAVLEHFRGGDDGRRIAYLGGEPAKWWTRSPASNDDGYETSAVAQITGEGMGSYVYECRNSRGIRPAIILSSDTFVAEDGSVDPVAIEDRIDTDGYLEAVAYDEDGNRAGSGWTYQWYRNGERIAGATGARLDARDAAGNLVVSFPNEYYVEARNGSAGTAKRSSIYKSSNLPGGSLGGKAVGDIVMLDVDGVPTEFIVVQQGTPSGSLYSDASGTWLLAKDVLEERAWSRSNLNDYEKSDVHAYLNGEWIAKLDSRIQAQAMQARIPYRPGSGTGKTIRSGTNGLPAKVFLLSSNEAGFAAGAATVAGEGTALEYFKGLYTGYDSDGKFTQPDDKRIAHYGGAAAEWWLRSPVATDDASVFLVGEEGGHWYNDSDVSYGIRPALILPSTLFVADDGSIDPVVIVDKTGTDGYLEAVAYDASGSRITSSSAGWTFRWYRNGKPIEGATGGTLAARDSGGNLVVTFPDDYYFEASNAADGPVKRSARYVPSCPDDGVLGALSAGSVVRLNVGGVPTDFIVVQQGNPDKRAAGNAYDSDSVRGTWLLAKDILEERAWSRSMLNDYENGDIHAYLNGRWIGNLDPYIRGKLLEARIPYRPGSGADKTIASGADGLASKAFLLSGAEVGISYGTMPVEGTALEYFRDCAATAADDKRIADYNGTAAEWWLRSPYVGSLSSYTAYTITAAGKPSFWGGTKTYGVRPALILPAGLAVDDGTIIYDADYEVRWLADDGADMKTEARHADAFSGIISVEDADKKAVFEDYEGYIFDELDDRNVLADPGTGGPVVLKLYYALDADGDGVPDKYEGKLGAQEVGNAVKLNVGGKPAEFVVVQKGNPDGTLYGNAGGVWLLSKEVLEERVWDASNLNDYEGSSIHAYLNGEWLAKLDPNIRDRLMEANLPYRPGSGAGTMIMRGAGGLPAKAFLLSYAEAGFTASSTVAAGEGVMIEYIKRTGSSGLIANLDGEPAKWWTRSPVVSDAGYADSAVAQITAEGKGSYVYECKNLRGVRPALILPAGLPVIDGAVDPMEIVDRIDADGHLEAVAYDDQGGRIASGDAEWTFQWYKNGEKIDGATGAELYVLDDEGNRDMEFWDEYYFEVSNVSDGRVKRSTAYVFAEEFKSLDMHPVGSVVKLNVGGTPTEFIVVQQGNPDGDLYGNAGGTWLLAKDILEKRAWNGDRLNDYENSSIHAYLNGDWLAKLDPWVRGGLMEARIPYRPGSDVGSKAISGGADGLPAKAFLLSAAETRAYYYSSYMTDDEGVALDYFKDCASGTNAADEKRIGYFSGSAIEWLLRSPYVSSLGYVYVYSMDKDGSISSCTPTSSYCGIRPALILPAGFKAADDGTVVRDIDYEMRWLTDDGTAMKSEMRRATVRDGKVSVGDADKAAVFDGYEGYIFDQWDDRNVLESGLPEDGGPVVLKLYYALDANGNGLPDKYEGELGNHPIGSVVKLDVGGKPEEFIIVQKGAPDEDLYGNAGGVWLLAKDALEKRAWDTAKTGDYGNSSIHAYLNGEWLAKLDPWVRDRLLEAKLPYRPGGVAGDKTIASGSEGLPARAFLLSGAEAGVGSSGYLAPGEGAVLGYFKSGDASTRIANFSGGAIEWWLRSPRTNSTSYAYYATTIGKSGTITYETSSSASYGVRPALILPAGIEADEEGMIGQIADCEVRWLADDGTVMKAEARRTLARGGKVSVQDADKEAVFSGYEDYVFDKLDERNVLESGLPEDGGPAVLKLYYALDADGDGMPDKYEGKLGAQEVGSVVKLNVDGKPAEFVVVQKGNPDEDLYGNAGGVWLLSKDALEKRAWDTAKTGDYGNSSIHAYLNGEWIAKLDPQIRDRLLEAKLPYRPGGVAGDKTIASGSEGLPARAFLLSGAEAGVGSSGYLAPGEGTALEYFGSGEVGARVADHNGSAIEWWLRSPRTDSTSYAYYATTIGKSGTITYETSSSDSYGVRPALILPGGLPVMDGMLDPVMIIDRIDPDGYLEAVAYDDDGTRIGSGNGEWTFQWYRNGVAIDGATDMALNAVDDEGDYVVTRPNEYYVEVACRSDGRVKRSGVYAATNSDGTLGAQDVGSVVKLNVDGVPTEFIVVNQGSPSRSLYDNADGTWLLAKDVLEKRAWNSSSENDYGNSTIHAYLNGEWIGKLDPWVQDQMIEAKLPYRPGSGTDKTISSGVDGLPARVFLPSGAEVHATASYMLAGDGAALEYFRDCSTTGADDKRIANLNGAAAEWWLRSPYLGSSLTAYTITAAGKPDYWGGTSSYGIRPALILPFNTRVADDGTIVHNVGYEVQWLTDDGTVMKSETRRTLSNAGKASVEDSDKNAVFDGYENYVFDEKDGRNVLEIDLPEDGSAVILKLYYSMDANGDGVPDKRQGAYEVRWLTDEDVLMKSETRWTDGNAKTASVEDGDKAASFDGYEGYIFDKTDGRNILESKLPDGVVVVLKLYYALDADGDGIPDKYQEDYAVEWRTDEDVLAKSETRRADIRDGKVSVSDGDKKAALNGYEGYVFDRLDDRNVPEGVPGTGEPVVLKLYYAPDMDGDGIPDKYQEDYTVEWRTDEDVLMKSEARRGYVPDGKASVADGDRKAVVEGYEDRVFDAKDSRNVLEGDLGTGGPVVLKLYYALDANGDGIPDKREGLLGYKPVGTVVDLDVDGVPTEFVIVQQGNPDGSLYAGGDGTWLLARDVLETRAFSDSNDNGYAESDIRTYLEDGWLAKLDPYVREWIVDVTIPYRAGSGGGTAIRKGADGLPSKAFLLSGAEAGVADSDMPAGEGAILEYFRNGSKIAYGNGEAAAWWLRSPSTEETGSMIGDAGGGDGMDEYGRSLADMAVGDVVRLDVGGTPTEFIVVQQGSPDGSLYSGGDGTWLLSKDVLETRAWSGNKNDYTSSTIHGYLNGEWLGKLDPYIKGKLVPANVPYCSISGNGKNATVNSGSKGLAASAFLLSGAEIGASNGNLPANEGKALEYFRDGTKLKELSGSWWLRSPDTSGTGSAFYVGANGSIASAVLKNATNGFRPALILESDLPVADDGTVVSQGSAGGAVEVSWKAFTVDAGGSAASADHDAPRGFRPALVLSSDLQVADGSIAYEVGYEVQWLTDGGDLMKSEARKALSSEESVSVTDEDKAMAFEDYEGYIFDGRDGNNVLEGRLSKDAGNPTVLRLYYALDEDGDGVPDKYDGQGYMMPDTGGIGTGIFQVSGLCAMALAAALWIARRRRDGRAD